MKQSVGIGIIGCGSIARLKHVQTLLKVEGAHIVALQDVHIALAEAIRSDFSLTSCTLYQQYEDLLNDSKVDAVHICTPNCYHAEIAIAALTAGKHVLVEKPMAIHADDAQHMLETAVLSGRKLSISYQNRYRKDIQYAKALCLDGTLGHIYHATAHAVRRRAVPTWGAFFNPEIQGGGPLIDVGTHSLDLAFWLMDNYDVNYVVGAVSHHLKNTESPANRWGPWDAHNFKVEDAAFGTIVMKNGAIVNVTASWALNVPCDAEAKVSLIGSRCGINMEGNLAVCGEKDGELYVHYPFQHEDNQSAKEAAYLCEMTAWIDALRYDTEVVVQPKQALVVTRVIEAIYQSAEIGQPIYFT